MPEASIDKHGNSQLRKNKIGASVNYLMAPPTSYSINAKDSKHRKLCRFVAAPTNTRHNFTTFYLRENIGHLILRSFKAGLDEKHLVA
jgi:hypothetical protein